MLNLTCEELENLERVRYKMQIADILEKQSTGNTDPVERFFRNLTAPKNTRISTALVFHHENKTLPQHILLHIRCAKLQLLRLFCAQDRKIPFSITQCIASAETPMCFINIYRLGLTTPCKVASHDRILLVLRSFPISITPFFLLSPSFI